MPDEPSNLNPSAAPRRPGPSRRRGRRGGRGRSLGPRPAADPAAAPAPDEVLPAAVAAAGVPPEMDEADADVDTSGDFREPHPETPESSGELSDAPAEPLSEPSSAPVASDPEPARAPLPPREYPRERRPDRRPEPPRAQKPWVKPADFRPAETSAISQAVAHATEIAASLKLMTDQLDEILELVEVAERQKLADEREIDELHRALRRIQPPRLESPPPPSRGPRRDEPRRDEPRREHRDPPPRREEPPVSREPEPPREIPPAGA